jgi:hypothetical protein
MQTFTAQPAAALNAQSAATLNAAIVYPEDECYLADHWDALHYLLTRGPHGDALPMGAIKRGEVAFSDQDDPTHGLTSATTRAFAAVLGALSRADLEARYDPPAMREASVYPGRFWIHADRSTGLDEETAGYFDRLRAFAQRAAEEGKGLIFCRYEGW